MEAVDPGIAPADNRQCSERHLDRDEGDKDQRGPRQVTTLWAPRPHERHGRHHERADDDGAEAMSKMHRDCGCPMVRNDAAKHQRKVGDGEPGARMPHRGADQNLPVHEDRRRRCKPAQRTVCGAPIRIGVVSLNPGGRGEERDGDRQAEEDLGEPGMCRRHRRRQEEQHGQSAKHALRNHRAERRDTEPAKPYARLGRPQPGREHDREEPDAAGNEAVTVLVQDVRDPHRRRKREHVPAVTRRPIGHGQSGVVAGDETPRQDQQDGAAGEEL